MSDPFFHPISGFDLPRFAGVPSFMRLPVVTPDHARFKDVQIGLVGVQGGDPGAEGLGSSLQELSEGSDGVGSSMGLEGSDGGPLHGLALVVEGRVEGFV